MPLLELFAAATDPQISTDLLIASAIAVLVMGIVLTSHAQSGG